jgi:hypothetical protein
MKQITVTYEIKDRFMPSFLGSAFIQGERDGRITIGLLKNNGDIYWSATVERDDFLADVAFITGANR